MACAAGKHSGRNALRTKLSQMGYDLSQEDLNDVFKRFKVSPAAGACRHRCVPSEPATARVSASLPPAFPMALQPCQASE